MVAAISHDIPLFSFLLALAVLPMPVLSLLPSYEAGHRAALVESGHFLCVGKDKQTESF
jgi:hypothetical protein